MPRFAIVEHDHPATHWDLFLEAGPVARSWRLGLPPGPYTAGPAEANADHRLLYLDYEGPVSGGRGSVTRLDAATFQWLIDTPEIVEVQLSGLRIRGRLRIDQGRFTFAPDPH